MQTIDNTGLACPEPVIRTKRALDALDEGSIVSIVDNLAAKENVLRLVQNLGLRAEVKSEQGRFHITITKGESSCASCQIMEPAAEQQVVLLVKSDLMGEGDAELGHVLMKSFFYALNESADRPQTIFFLNSAVRLTCAGSPVLDHLRSLAEQGVEIMSCGTCLDFYHLKDQLALGGVTNMYSIVEGLMQADKAITL